MNLVQQLLYLTQCICPLKRPQISKCQYSRIQFPKPKQRCSQKNILSHSFIWQNPGKAILLWWWKQQNPQGRASPFFQSRWLESSGKGFSVLGLAAEEEDVSVDWLVKKSTNVDMTANSTTRKECAWIATTSMGGTKSRGFVRTRNCMLRDCARTATSTNTIK